MMSNFSSEEGSVTSAFQGECGGELPIVRIGRSTKASTSTESTSKKLKRVHRARRKRSDSRNPYQPQPNQNWPGMWDPIWN